MFHERCNGTGSLNFQMDVKKWAYIMIGVMEELFPHNLDFLLIAIK
jgi:hypothetical protein